MNKVKNCKTFIHRFDSDPRLQPNPTENQGFRPIDNVASQGFGNALKPVENDSAVRMSWPEYDY
jgi:hypothetical protein